MMTVITSYNISFSVRVKSLYNTHCRGRKRRMKSTGRIRGKMMR